MAAGPPPPKRPLSPGEADVVLKVETIDGFAMSFHGRLPVFVAAKMVSALPQVSEAIEAARKAKPQGGA